VNSLGYWGFVPADEGYGMITCWGCDSVVASNHSAMAVGEKGFGYLPMGSHLVLRAQKLSE